MQDVLVLCKNPESPTWFQHAAPLVSLLLAERVWGAKMMKSLTPDMSAPHPLEYLEFVMLAASVGTAQGIHS